MHREQSYEGRRAFITSTALAFPEGTRDTVPNTAVRIIIHDHMIAGYSRDFSKDQTITPTNRQKSVVAVVIAVVVVVAAPETNKTRPRLAPPAPKKGHAPPAPKKGHNRDTYSTHMCILYHHSSVYMYIMYICIHGSKGGVSTKIPVYKIG